MTNTRANPTTGQLEVFHAETNTWVLSATLLQIAGGFNVALAGSQAQLLSQMAGDTGKLAELLTQTQTLNSALAQIKIVADVLRDELQNDTNPGLQGMSSRLANIEAAFQSLLTKADALQNTTANGTNTLLTQINGKTIDYSTNFATVGGLIGDLKTLTTTLIGLANPKTPVIQKVTINASDAEFPFALPENTKILSFKCRRNAVAVAADLRYGFVVNQVANPTTGNYRTLEAYNEYSERLGNFNGTLYLAATGPTAGNAFVVEIEAWS